MSVDANHPYGSKMNRVFWIFQFTFWITVGLVMLNLINSFHPMTGAWMIAGGRAVIGFLLTWGLRETYRTPWMQRMKGFRKWAMVFALILGACLLGTLFWMAVLHYVKFPEFMEPMQLRSMTVTRLVSLLFWNGLYFGLEKLEESHELRLKAEAALTLAKESELRQLKDQLNPHFLFNSLNTIVAHCEDPRAVCEITGHLSDYLRFILGESNPLEPLAREIDALEDYLCVQKLRFGENLQFLIRSSPEALRVMVPPMMIQPLLENAFKYGALTSPMPLIVEVAALVEEGMLKVSVTNSGTWLAGDATATFVDTPEGDPAAGLPPAQGSGTGTSTGLSNLRKRLSLLLGKEATLEISRGAERVAVVIRVRIPSHPLASPHAEKGLTERESTHAAS